MFWMAGGCYNVLIHNDTYWAIVYFALSSVAAVLAWFTWRKSVRPAWRMVKICSVRVRSLKEEARNE
jgi:hypothetical protein